MANITKEEEIKGVAVKTQGSDTLSRKLCDSQIWEYLQSCRKVSNLNDWMQLNKERFGSRILYSDEAGVGFLFGYASGYTINRALRLGIVLLGCGFVTLQTLSYYGYLKVDWDKVEKAVRKPLDLNNDGKIDEQDARIFKDRMIAMLSRGLPCTAGLSAGLALGLLRS